MFEREVPVYERPCAMPGLISFRYRGAYGWIMIGAKNITDALKEAQRSTLLPVKPENLEIYLDGEYTKISSMTNVGYTSIVGG